MTNLVQPIALITGGSRGLGKSAAHNLAKRGVDVLLTYRTGASEAREVVAEVERLGRKAAALHLDVSDSATFPAFVASVRTELERGWKRDRFEFLVNNAGGGGHASFVETSEAQLDELYRVHLKAPFLLSQKLLPLMADGGRILNVTTGLTRYVFPGQSAYAAMKGAVEVFSRFMAVELGERRITVNCVAPGGIVTDFGGGLMKDPGLQQMVASQTPLGRMGQPDDVGAVVAFLLSPEAAWINGERIELAGGFRL